MKEGSRVLGIDDAPRELEKLIGVVYRGTEFIEQVEVIDQETDTGDSTGKILELEQLFAQNIEALLLDGVSFNGFNIADIIEISEESGKPVIAVTTNRPNKEVIKSCMDSAGINSEIMDDLPKVHEIGDLYIQFSGCDLDEACEIVEKSTCQGNIPEAIRAAHLIGKGLSQD